MSSDVEDIHRPVLLDEVLDLLGPHAGTFFVDATTGLGGHSEGILQASSTSRVLCIDRDASALELARKRLSRFGDRVRFAHANFAEIGKVVRDAGEDRPDGIVADLGVSSLQLDSVGRGFSFRFDAPLDMRMDTSSGETAAELLARLPEADIANLIYRYGEERASRRIAKWIVEKRDAGHPIGTTSELADLVKRAVRTNPKDRIHPATRTFQALRIAVNGELDILDTFIADSIDLLETNGILAAITFHSLEDRTVKQAFQFQAGRCRCPPRLPQCVCGAAKKVEVLTRKPLIPTLAEQNVNPRSRSAKLRACRKAGS
jgi:16S rRNA (cytosine1402-N4)-methyltransferase